MYIYLTVKFSIRGVDRMTTVSFVYNWYSKCILDTSIKDDTDDMMTEAFKMNITNLSAIGFKPVFNIMDNV